MNHISPFIRRVSEHLPSPGLVNPVLESIPFRTSCLEKGDDILSVGTPVRQVLAIGQGLAMRYRLLPDGGRQVIMFLTPGDICNPHIYPTVIDHCVAAVTPVRIDRFDCESIIGLTTTIVGLNQALWALMEEQNAIMRDHITSLGRSDARSRVVALLRDIAGRMSGTLVQANQTNQVFIPVTQSLLADAVGVTHIHFNRVISELAKRGILATSRGGILVKDLSRLKDIGEDATVAA